MANSRAIATSNDRMTTQQLNNLLRQRSGQLATSVPESYRSTFTVKRMVDSATMPGRKEEKDFLAERIIKVVVIAAKKNPQLLECDIDSITMSVMESLAMGLEPGGPLGHSYLVPRGGKCTLIIGYRGMIALARRGGAIVNVEAHAVYKNDRFRVMFGSTTQVIHEPTMSGDRGELIAVHCRADFANGGSHIEVMTREEVDEHIPRRKDGKPFPGPWVNHYSEMAKKTVVRRAAKYWPQALDLIDAMVLQEDQEIDDDERTLHVIDASEVTHVAPPTAMTKARQAAASVREALDRATDEPPMPDDDTLA